MARACSVLGLAVALGTIGCTTSTSEMPVRVEYDRSADFVQWKTFRVSSDSMKTSSSSYPRYARMIREALIDELTSRGYSRIEDGTPDFRVAFDLDFRGDGTVQMAPEGGGAEPMARSYAGGRPHGSLTVKMLGPIEAKVLWTGVVTGIKVDAISAEDELKKAVWRVLAEFPPLTS